jgi:hypothetical protein
MNEEMAVKMIYGYDKGDMPSFVLRNETVIIIC